MPADGRGRARRLSERDRRGARAVVGQRERDRLDAVAGEDVQRGGAAHDARRAVVVARDREIGLAELPERRLARKELEAGFLRGEARGEARRAARPLAGVAQFLGREELAPDRPLASRAAAARCARSRPCRCRSDRSASAPSAIASRPAAARTTSAAFVPPKPRDRTSATSLRGVCADADTGSPAHAGSSRCSVAMPGTVRARNAASARTVSMMPEAASRWPNAHLNAVTGGGRGAEDRAQRARFRHVGLPGAVAVRDDHADVGGAKSRVLERDARSPARARRRRRGSAAALRLRSRSRCRGSRRGPAAPRSPPTCSVSSTSAAAPSPITLPLRSTSNGRSASSRQQPDAVVVEHHLRLDRRVVTHRDGALAFAGRAAPAPPR